MNTIERFRCDSGKCLRRAADLIDMRDPRDGRRDYVIATGPCGKCGACFTDEYGSYGPAGRSNIYTRVGVKVTLVPGVKCAARCIGATSLECKCSCGGARHGVAGAR